METKRDAASISLPIEEPTLSIIIPAFNEAYAIGGVIQKDYVLASGDEARRLYEEGYYGIPDTKLPNQILFDPFEAALLAERSRLTLRSKKGIQYSPKEFIEQNTLKQKQFWEKYLVYKDLRNRGYPAASDHSAEANSRHSDKRRVAIVALPFCH